MVTVKMFKRNGSYLLSMRDHASDRLVCAAVSALGLTLTNVLRIMDKEGQLCSAYFKAECGNIELEVRPKAEHDEETMHCFYIAAVGLAMLQGKYPQDISFEDHFAG